MSRIRRAFLMSSVEQYLALVINLSMVAVLARLLKPAEIGIAVIGMGVAAVVFSLREFATPEFLIQRDRIERRDVRTANTVLMALSLVLAAFLYLAAGPLCHFYGEPGLKAFLAVMLVASLIEASALTSVTLLRRELSFGVLARIRTTASIVTAGTTIWLAWTGHSYMSYAWGLFAGAVTNAVLAHLANPSARDFRPSLAARHEIFAFGCFKGATTVVEKIYETLPQMWLGYFMPMSAVGYYNRANAICGIPDRVFLSSIFAIAFPALATQLREGHDIKDAYLRLLSYISVVYWPALTVVAITADAIVDAILGPGWAEVVPLVRLLALAALFWFPVIPTNPLLLAMGRNRDAFAASLIARSVAAVILCSASLYGLLAMAASQFLALPFQMAVALYYAKKHVCFTWGELLAAIAASAGVTLCSVAGPLAVAATAGADGLSLVEFGFAAVTAAIGWGAGLYWTRHPLWDELLDVVAAHAPFALPHAGRRSAAPAE